MCQPTCQAVDYLTLVGSITFLCPRHNWQYLNTRAVPYKFRSRFDTLPISVRRNRASSKSKVSRTKHGLGSYSPPPALPVKTRQTLRRRVVPPPEYDVPDESYDTIENYPMRPPPIPPKVVKPPPVPPRA